MSHLRAKGYRLSCFYGFIDLERQLTDCMLQYFVFLIERVNFLPKAVGVADVSRGTKHDETVSDASQTKRKWSSIFLHSMSPMPIADACLL